VAIRRTQQGPGLKLAHKYFGVIKALRNDRYILRKVGEHKVRIKRRPPLIL